MREGEQKKERGGGESIIGCGRRRNVAHQSKRREEGGRMGRLIKEAALENIRQSIMVLGPSNASAEQCNDLATSHNS